MWDTNELFPVYDDCEGKNSKMGKMLRLMKRHVCTIIDHTYIVLVFLFLSKAGFLCATIKRLIYKWPHRCFFANDLKHVSSTAKLLSIKLYNMSKTGYRQVYNIQDKLFYSEIKFQIIEFSVLAK